MDTTTSIQPKTMAELLPGLSGIQFKDNIRTMTAKKQPRQTVAQTHSVEKVKPLTIAEMRTAILALKVQSPSRVAQAATTSKKRTWNTSVKVDNKIVSRTANGQMNNNSVRKVLNFQPKPKTVSNLRATTAQESPKFPKPEFRAKRSLHPHARSNMRISGISNIPETPVVSIPKKIQRSQMTLANKENIPNRSVRKTTITAQPKVPYHNKLINAAPATPISNETSKSSCDASFLQKEQEINEKEEKLKELAEQMTIDNITENTPPASTPFKEYRSVQEFFHNSDNADNSTMYHDNTIMCFDNNGGYKENAREESVIVSLCDLLNKASVDNSMKKNLIHKTPAQNICPQSEVERLMQMVNNTEQYIKLIDDSIAAFSKMKESQINHLQTLQKLLEDKQPVAEPPIIAVRVTQSSQGNSSESVPKPGQVSSVIKTAAKSPSYKVPKKNHCLRKKMLYKSMPNVGNVETPVKTDMGNRALSMYMKMKEHMNFLTTPVSTRPNAILDTPAVTSNNLQKQLDKLYAN